MSCVSLSLCGSEGFPLWCMTWPRPHREQSLAITTEEHHSSMPLVSPNTVGCHVGGAASLTQRAQDFLREKDNVSHD